MVAQLQSAVGQGQVHEQRFDRKRFDLDRQVNGVGVRSGEFVKNLVDLAVRGVIAQEGRGKFAVAHAAQRFAAG